MEKPTNVGRVQRVLIVIDSGSIDSMLLERKINGLDQLSSDLRPYEARGEWSRCTLLLKRRSF
jgi:hypothetical protein